MRNIALLVCGLALFLISPQADARFGCRRRCQPQCQVVPSSFVSEEKPPAKKPPPVDLVKKAIDRGIKYLRQTQREKGDWEVNLPSVVHKGGWTSLALLALLNASVPVNDPMIVKGLAYLRELRPGSTYVRALQTMVFVEAGQKEDSERIANNVQWLIDARVFRTGELRGWSYNKNASFTSDNSNTQYALLGLQAGKKAGARIKQEIWKSIRDYYIRTQETDGGFLYDPTRQTGGGPSLTMTTAGLCGLLIAGMELNAGREILQKDGTAKNCGQYKENPAVQKALNWISGPRRDRLQIDLPMRTFYSLYGIARAGELSGRRFFGNHDWYREGCVFLLKDQKEDGSWQTFGAWDHWPVVSTSFALLFLAKGRTPVLINKLVHTPNGRRDKDDLDWNNDKNDLRHLTEFARNKLFNDRPLSWQIFDTDRAAGPTPKKKDLDDVTADLLQTPILYFNGHKNPNLRLTGTERTILQQYVEKGGFILAEACCGRKDFDKGFKELAQALWPKNPLKNLPADHPVWKSYHPVRAGRPYKLMGIQMGKRTVLIYSPQDLSCRWESNNLNDGQVLTAFRLGANIIAYATNMKMPAPRLITLK
jgi:hypothetical protein